MTSLEDIAPDSSPQEEETVKKRIEKAIPFFGEREPQTRFEAQAPSFGTSPMKPKNPIHWSEED